MRRITFTADDALAERIRRTARLRRKSVSEIIREKVEQGFEAERPDDRFPFIGMLESDGKWSADQLEEYLKETWSDAMHAASRSMSVVVVDAGVLIGAADRRDRSHRQCTELLRSREFEFVIPALCVAEAVQYIGDRMGADAEAVFLAGMGRVPVLAPEAEEWLGMSELVREYGDFPLGGCDASIVVLAERLNTDLIATLDHRHFRAIKPRHCEFFRLLPELP